MRSTRRTLLGVNGLALLALAAQDDRLIFAPQSQANTTRRIRTDPSDEMQQQESNAAKEIADWNAAVDQRRAEKRARKAARREA